MIVLEWLDRELRSLGWHIRSIQQVQGGELMQLTLDFNNGSPWATVRIINSPHATTEDLLKFIKEYKEELDAIH